MAVSKAKTEIMCLCTRGMSDAIVTFSVEAAGQVYKQMHDFVYLGGNVNHHADLSIDIDRRIRNAWWSFRKYSSNCTTDRATPRAHDPDTDSRRTRDNAVRLCHVEPARVPLRHATQSPPQLRDPLQ